MELRHIETFLKIAELRSFTRAADELCITQPTVSKQIVDLERFFEVRLIDRTKRTVTLTKAGEILLQYALDMVSLKRDTIEAIASFRGLKKGKMTLGASTIPGIYIMPRLLSAFKKRYAGINLELVVSDTKDIIEKMENGLLDIGMVGAKSETAKIEFRKLVDDTIIFIAPPDFPDTLTVAQLAECPIISRERGSGTRNTLETSLAKIRDFRKRGLSIIAELSDNEAIKHAVMNGMGMAYVSRIAVAGEMATGALKEITVQGLPEIRRSFFTITRKGKTILPQVKVLMEIIDRWRKNEKV
ncbi:MAG: selenium metabolism-associated LysR family transcriptional regulator [Syntrophorhabdaceae bacterium]|nr:selenium metabolism-associated LysR family transcriptional regulator [Syntrophorhabdaceae bacterium]